MIADVIMSHMQIVLKQYLIYKSNPYGVKFGNIYENFIHSEPWIQKQTLQWRFTYKLVIRKLRLGNTAKGKWTRKKKMSCKSSISDGFQKEASAWFHRDTWAFTLWHQSILCWKPLWEDVNSSRFAPASWGQSSSCSFRL